MKRMHTTKPTMLSLKKQSLDEMFFETTKRLLNLDETKKHLLLLDETKKRQSNLKSASLKVSLTVKSFHPHCTELRPYHFRS